ncbi:MAG TPA: lytic transglycosylase domain-containing protein [Solirubrobacteraceae bacterium]|jgi:soluble lytic murein transglycosylase-like protein|nr:lytic transglycosylase domain-containing protein [Solirubrobacteraceae bacterium]
MSTEALAPAGMPTGELAVSQRVAQLQSLIEQTAHAAAGESSTESIAATTPASTSQSFAETLQAASGTATTASATPLPSGGESAQSSQYDSLVEAAAQRYGIEPAVLHGLIQQESGFDPSAQSSAGASGLTQLMPATASSMGVSNPLNPAESIEGGARYLSQLMSEFSGNTTDALAAYNAGPGAVKQYGGVPPYAETQSYVTKVLGYAEAFRQSHPTSAPVAA